MSHIGWGGEQITIYKGVETFPVLKPRGKAQKGQFLLTVGLGRYTARLPLKLKCLSRNRIEESHEESTSLKWDVECDG